MRRIVLAGGAIILLLGALSYWFVVSHREVATPHGLSESAPPPPFSVIGKSVEGRDIRAYSFGKGNTHLLFVGGMHGGYEWNSVLLAYQFIDYFQKNPQSVPGTLSVDIIPDINPDGVFKVVGKSGRFVESDVNSDKEIQKQGRFNANQVDLNRNFDCNWSPDATWQNKKESAGTATFSEPETRTLRDFVGRIKPSVAVFWHSQANAVYASECNKGILPETLDVMNAYAKAAGYPSVKKFDAYKVTGDSEGWLASIGVPAITVELKTHETTEWDKNLAGVEALINYFTGQK